MYILENKDTFVRLSKDLKVLEFGNEKTSFQTTNPFLIDLTGIPVNVDNMLNKEVTYNDKEITITFSDIVFAARFPGNSYCRPDPRFAPKLKFSVTITIEDGDLIIKSSPIENLGKFKARLILAQGFFTSSTNWDFTTIIASHKFEIAPLLFIVHRQGKYSSIQDNNTPIL